MQQTGLFQVAAPMAPPRPAGKPCRCEGCTELIPAVQPRAAAVGLAQCRLDPVWKYRGGQARCSHGRTE